jgi:hypothetical protein
MKEGNNEGRNQGTNEQTGERTNERLNERTNKRTNEQTNKLTNKQTNKQTNERTNEQTIKRTKERTNKQTNERILKGVSSDVTYKKHCFSVNRSDSLSDIYYYIRMFVNEHVLLQIFILSKKLQYMCKKGVSLLLSVAYSMYNT